MTKPIVVAGDSYSLEWPKQFKTLVPNRITNLSSVGRSNLFIHSSLINYLADVKESHLVIMGNSFITRQDTWQPYEDNKDFHWEVAGHPERQRGNRSVPLQKLPEKYEKWFRHSDICMLWLQYYKDLYTLAHTMKAMGHDFFFFNAAENVLGDTGEDQRLDFNFRGYLFNTPYYKWCHEQNNILPGDTFSIKEWCKEHNVNSTDTFHIATNDGCLVFSKWLKDQLEKVKLL